jgi:RNA polymerase-binding protein DksA
MAVSVDIEAVKRRLAAERTGILEERRRLLEDSPRPPEAGDDDGGGDGHSADDSSEVLNREVSLSLEDNAEHLLAAIDSALARVAAGTYGKCDRCEGVIGSERLEALPWATKCIECKRLEERG